MNRNWLLLILLFLSSLVSAQQSPPVTGNFNNVPVETFIRQLETQTSYQFYYDVRQLDSININLEVKDQPLADVLKKAFANTALLFSIDNQNRVFITKRVQLIAALPPDYFQRSAEQAKNPNAVTLNPEVKTTKKTNTENRIYEIGNRQAAKNGPVILTGYVRNERSGEPVISASVFVENLNVGALTDKQGYYTLTLPEGSHTLTVQSIGMKDSKYRLIVYSKGSLDIELKEQVTTLKEVVISAQKVAGINRVQMGVERLNIETVKKVPTLFGEADVMRVVLTLPGVKTVGEVSSGFNVRGGSADQNLILMNGTTVYNSSHFFGMFSAFNPELVKDIELYKSSIPAKYGGRLSSVLDVGLREGNKKEIHGSAGVGLVTSRINLEGPIVKDKTSFIVGARTTYANWLLQFLPTPYDRAKASFNDANIGITHRFSKKDEIYFTAYLSNDEFNLASDTTYSYGNRNINLRWKHNFSSKLIGFFSGGYDRYKYNVKGEKNKVNAYELAFDVNQANLKADFAYSMNSSHNIEFGVNSIRYTLHPGSFQPKGSESLVVPDEVAPEQALETAFYISDRFTVSPRLTLSGGIRYSIFNALGPGEIDYYAHGLPRNESNVVETKSYGSGSIMKTYHGPEYRLSLRYLIGESFSVKAGYNSARQYIHMLSNTTAIAPTDIWKLSDPNIKPQQGNQYSLGFYKNLKSNTIETSVEVYYKKIKDYLDYKPGAVLVMNHHVETDVVNTKGKAYGVELMIRKTVGKLNGWVSYTYSRILLKMDDPSSGVTINNGEWYPANYDKPHDVTAVGNFRVNHRFSISTNITYSTGRPITLPVGRYYYAGSQRVLYSDRNSYRIPDYFRSDLSLNIDGNYKVKQKTHNSWTIGVYNLTGRKNAFSIYYVSENGRINGYRLSIFGSAIPFINFNIRF